MLSLSEAPTRPVMRLSQHRTLLNLPKNEEGKFATFFRNIIKFLGRLIA